MVGATASIGEGKADFWLVLADKDGSMQWDRAYGGAKEDKATQIIEDFDGNVFIAGYNPKVAEVVIYILLKQNLLLVKKREVN
jgi:hypothetical protein